jgi:tRNA-binding EMAP/Myf-like protein
MWMQAKKYLYKRLAPYYMTQQVAFTKKGKIRGQESHGMICAEDELGLELAMTVS